MGLTLWILRTRYAALPGLVACLGFLLAPSPKRTAAHVRRGFRTEVRWIWLLPLLGTSRLRGPNLAWLHIAPLLHPRRGREHSDRMDPVRAHRAEFRVDFRIHSHPHFHWETAGPAHGPGAEAA